ncbi:hypothetical protein [Spongiivirga citrea]|uniref:Uncharacterized protein n=1 Tax=Spongiivirga citrea TaxID=1481457 RepID=A0A6M0CFG3_9FLAO|nr:hypothetical protein [Spongiivirga citrea]NER16586.1 hypothetical protein [Spongiivirga citrea]
MKKPFTLLIFVSTLLISCSKEEVQYGDIVETVFFPIASDFKADGKSTINVDVRFVKDADLSKIDAKARINKTFTTHENEESEEISLAPEVTDNGRIQAEFTIVSTTRPGNFRVEIEVNKYRKFYPLKSLISLPESISLSRSSNSVQSGFLGEVIIEGLILNSEGAKASQGVKAQVLDLLEDGSSAGGVFRAQQLSSNGDSKISMVYSPGSIPSNQFITIFVELIDEDGTLLGISDNIRVFAYNE